MIRHRCCGSSTWPDAGTCSTWRWESLARSPLDAIADEGVPIRAIAVVIGRHLDLPSAAYLQSWAQKEVSRISFNTPKTLAWDADGGGFANIARRHAQVYVFALLAHTNKATVNPLDLDQWVFYVLPTAILDGRTRSQQSITLRTLETLTTAVGFAELRQAVNLAADPAPLSSGKPFA